MSCHLHGYVRAHESRRAGARDRGHRGNGRVNASSRRRVYADDRACPSDREP